jgi:hypothetical protein
MINQEFELTAASPAVAAVVAVWPEYVRLPPPGKLDPFFGLTRSYLNLLILPSRENDFRPPVRSSVLRQPNAKTGVRLVNVASLRAYLMNQTDPPAARAGAHQTPHEHSEPVQPNAGVEFLRLPKSKERDPLFGLSRTFLNQLILSCEENGYRPPGAQSRAAPERISARDSPHQRGQPSPAHQSARRTRGQAADRSGVRAFCWHFCWQCGF